MWCAIASKPDGYAAYSASWLSVGQSDVGSMVPDSYHTERDCQAARLLDGAPTSAILRGWIERAVSPLRSWRASAGAG
ncbi:hypothetical protein BE11_36295 [Sorangium cellulosum]|nr:hypothetical protein BE11_36295 [Sorangium cellulosum]